MNMVEFITGIHNIYVYPIFIIAKFNKMKSCPNTYFITVIVDTELDLVIGAGTIIVEQKFIHGCGEVISQCLISFFQYVSYFDNLECYISRIIQFSIFSEALLKTLL